MKHIPFRGNRKPILLTIIVCLIFINTYSQSPNNSVRDKDGNFYPIETMPDNKTWMTTNLNINIPNSYCYEDSLGYCKLYGRLYTWQAAQTGCKLLGNGWRLPSNEEWQQLAKAYGGVRGDSQDSGKAAYKALFTGGPSGFNAVYGGGRDDGKYSRVEGHGFYWTASEIDSAQAWFYNFGKGMQILNRHDGEKNQAISVRCIRD